MATARGWVLGTVLDGVAPQEKKENPFFLAREKRRVQVWKRGARTEKRGSCSQGKKKGKETKEARKGGSPETQRGGKCTYVSSGAPGGQISGISLKLLVKSLKNYWARPFQN